MSLTTFVALAAYEYVITFRQEVDTVWKKRQSATSILLLMTRWTLLLGALIGVVQGPAQVGCLILFCPHLI